MIDYRLHRVSSADWQVFRDIRLRALSDTPDAFGTTWAEEKARSDAHWQARAADDSVAQFLAIASDGHWVGLAVGAPYTDYDDAAGLFSMWVAPDARGQRIGTALVETVIAWARSENYRRVVLDVGDANTAAVRLYESCGFVANGMTGALPAPRQHLTEHQRHLLL